MSDKKLIAMLALVLPVFAGCESYDKSTEKADTMDKAADVAMAESPAAETDSGITEAIDEVTMNLSDAPAPALAAARAAVPDVELTTLKAELEDGVASYEFSGTDAAGRQVEVDTTAAGEVTEIEREVAFEDVPAEVMDLLDAELPGFTPERAERSERPDGSIVWEFDGYNEAGETVDVEVADGVVSAMDDATN